MRKLTRPRRRAAPVAAPAGPVADHVVASPPMRLEHRYLECAPLASAVVAGSTHELVFANARFRDLSQRVGANAEIGAPVVEALPSTVRERLTAVLDRVQRDRTAVHGAQLGVSPKDPARTPRSMWSCDAWPAVEDGAGLDHLVLTVRPSGRRERTVSRQRALAERLVLSSLREQDRARLADVSRERALFLAEASRRLGASFEMETVYNAVATVVLPKLGAWSVVEVDAPDGSWLRLPIVHPDPTKAALIRELAQQWFPASGDPIGAPLVAQTRASTIIDRDIDNVLAAAAHDPDTLRLLRGLGVGALLVVPLVARGMLRGAITFVDPIGAAPYTTDDLQLAEELATRCANLLDGARLYHGMRVLQIDAVRARARADSARKDAEQANQAKTSFLTTMSHELRTPLNAILGYTDLIATHVYGPVTPEQIGALTRIREASRHLLGLINNVLNFARLKALQVRFDSATRPVSELLDSATQMVEPQARAKEIRFVRMPCLPTLMAYGDPAKLLQILLNLLSNAVKFTGPGGRITLAAAPADRRRRAQDPMAPRRSGMAHAVELTVSDSGRGIDARQLETLFEPFVQVGDRLTGRDEGTGLGLAISRDLARAMGGDITVVSSIGAGSTFTVTIPSRAPG